MELILSVKNGQYFLEKVEELQDGKSRKKTNNQDKIFQTIENIKSSAIRITYRTKSARLYLGNGLYITLKDYKNYNNLDLYSHILGMVNEQTRVQNEIDNINKKRIIALGATVVSLSVAAFIGNNNQSIKVPAAVETITTIPTPTPIVTNIPTPTITPTATPTPTPTITPTPTPAVFDKEYRMAESLELFSSNTDNGIIPLATGITEFVFNRMSNFMNSADWNHYERYGSDFGIDKYLLLAIDYTESNLEHEKTLPNGSGYNGHAVGISQHENPNNERDITAYNYNTGQWETERMTMESACDLELNIKMAAMILQNRLHKYNNNIYLVIQSYNYGESAINDILNAYSEETGKSIDDIINDYTDIGWLKYVKDYHENPQKYNPKWQYKTYGNDEYLNRVLGYYIGTVSENLLPDGSKVSTDLISLEKHYEVKNR